MPQGRYAAQRYIPRILEDAENGLPMLARRLLHDVYLRLSAMNEQLLAYDRELEHLAKDSETARRLMTIPGVGAVTATAMLASVGDPKQFKNGRAFCAWLGLVPRQYTTGGKIRLGRITKRGDVYLRTLLIHGTRAVLSRLTEKPDRLSAWSRALVERRGYRRATVALAAKNARILWALMSRGTTYQLKTA
jgi:transposase